MPGFRSTARAPAADRMLVHRLEALDHRLVVLDAMLHVDRDAVPAALCHDLGREAAWDGQPGIDAGLSCLQPLFSMFVILAFPRLHGSKARIIGGPVA